MESKFENILNVMEKHCDEEMEFEIQLSPFHNVPVEVFLHICSFLDIKDIAITLGNVCKRFKYILSDENIWRYRFISRWSSGHLESFIKQNGFEWKSACVATEEEWSYWRSPIEKFQHISVSDVHISSVDALLIINSGKTCVSGSRDRSIVIWNIPTHQNEKPSYTQKQVAHAGWIWQLVNDKDIIYSCSWDHQIKGWNISSDLTASVTFRCLTPVLAMTIHDGVIYAGDFGRKIYGFDPRVGSDPVTVYTVHKRSVLTLGVSGSCIISGSEDKTISVWDVRARKMKQKIHLENDCFPNTSSIDNDIVYVGDNRGNIHVYNPACDKLELCNTFTIGHTKPISAMKHSMGYLLTSSLDGSVRISVPSLPPFLIHRLVGNSDICSLDYSNGLLVNGALNAVEFYVPKKFYD